MNEGNSAVAKNTSDVLELERENNELATQQVKKINDTLRKVRHISRESQRMSAVSAEPPSVVEEVVVPSLRDSRREREDDTGQYLIPEPSQESTVSAVFSKAFELFEEECRAFNFSRAKGTDSPVVKKWKLM